MVRRSPPEGRDKTVRTELCCTVHRYKVQLINCVKMCQNCTVTSVFIAQTWRHTWYETARVRGALKTRTGKTVSFCFFFSRARRVKRGPSSFARLASRTGKLICARVKRGPSSLVVFVASVAYNTYTRTLAYTGAAAAAASVLVNYKTKLRGARARSTIRLRVRMGEGKKNKIKK